MSADLDATRRLAGSQHHRYRPASFGVVDMDRQEAAFVIMGVEQRQLLMTVHDVAGVVDIENDRRGLALVRRNPLIDQGIVRRITSFSEGAFSSRDRVGCEHKSAPESGSRPQANLNAGSVRRKSRSSASS